MTWIPILMMFLHLGLHINTWVSLKFQSHPESQNWACYALRTTMWFTHMASMCCLKLSVRMSLSTHFCAVQTGMGAPILWSLSVGPSKCWRKLGHYVLNVSKKFKNWTLNNFGLNPNKWSTCFSFPLYNPIDDASLATASFLWLEIL